MKAGSIVIGKRITVGAAILGLSEAVQTFFPEYATAIGQLTVPIIFIVQVVIANKFGVTQ